jgi:hypothetical protein
MRDGAPPDSAETAVRGSVLSAVWPGRMRAAWANDLGQWRRLERVEWSSRWRMAKWRRRRIVPGGAEREGGRERACGLHYLGAKLLERLKSTGKRRNGGVAEGTELGQSFNGGGARKLGFCEGGGCDLAGSSGGPRRAIYREEGEVLGVRAKARQRGRRSDSGVRLAHGVEEDPDK